MYSLTPKQIVEIYEAGITFGENRQCAYDWGNSPSGDVYDELENCLVYDLDLIGDLDYDVKKFWFTEFKKEAGIGMKAKTIKAVIAKKMKQWWDSIEDESVRKLAEKNTIVTGGCIASMLLKEKVNDFDVYFRTKEATEAVAQYYVDKFCDEHDHPMKLEVTDERIRIVTERGHRGETAGDPTQVGLGEIEDTYDDANELAQEIEDNSFRPVFMSTNAITLSNKVQIVIRFFGDPAEIHENYDFVHCTNHWTSWSGGELVLQPAALEALLARELRYVGSKYPLCSIMRIRKFIQRGWTINAGQILKACMQLNDLDLTDPKVLEDQLTGVDSAYFIDMINKLRENDPEKINAAYLVELVDRIF